MVSLTWVIVEASYQGYIYSEKDIRADLYFSTQSIPQVNVGCRNNSMATTLLKTCIAYEIHIDL